MNIRVIDSPCGTGKTEYAIKYMNENSENTNFIYITPFLSEIERVMSNVNFKISTPKEGSKSKDLLELVFKGKHIATTHSLFNRGNGELARLLEDNGYELILDEVLTVLDPIPFKKGDFTYLKRVEAFEICEDNVVKLSEFGKDLLQKGTEFKSKLELIESGRVILVDDMMLVWEFPADLLKCFNKITIMTYLFKQQTMCNYLLANGAEFEYFYLENYNLISGACSYDGRAYKNLVKIYDGKLNSIGQKAFSLSSSWFIDKNNFRSKKILMDNAFNYFYHNINKRIDRVLWTIPKQIFNDGLFVKSYKGAFLEMTARATNLYAERDTCAYLVNRFENPMLQKYFQKHGLSVNDDVFALSELIQWLFRSAIRKNKPINLYIPSKRMRELLQAWLDGSFDEKYNKKD